MLWWLILYVKLTGPQGPQTFSQTLFWVCLWVFPHETDIELVDLSKAEIAQPNTGRHNAINQRF